MYLSQSQISGWRRKYCLRRRYKGHRIRRFSKGLSRHILVRQSLSAVFHGALTKSRPAIVPESAPFKTARSVCSGESTLCPLDWRRKDFLFHPLTNVCSPEMSRELFTDPKVQRKSARSLVRVRLLCGSGVNADTRRSAPQACRARAHGSKSTKEIKGQTAQFSLKIGSLSHKKR